MTSNVELFNHAQFGTIRTFDDGARIWYCGIDVARALGYAKPLNAIKAHVRAYTLKRGVGVVTGKRSDGSDAMQTVEMLFIQEADVYRLIAHSKLPAAQAFEKWLFEEVTPQVVHTGSYSAVDPAKLFSDPEAIMRICENWKADKERADKLEAQNARMLPKAQLAEAVIEADGSINVADLSAILQQVPGTKWKKGRNTLHKALLGDGFTRRNRNGHIVPSQKSIELGILRVAESYHYDGSGNKCIDLTTMVTPKGQAYFVKKYAQTEEVA